jgi:hypothetical protein
MNRLLSSNRSPWKRHPLLCHPERSRGICSSADLALLSMEASPSPLSSRAQPRDLQFSGLSNCSPWKRRPPLCHPERSRGICGSADLATALHGSVALPFVIPSAAEGSAVQRPFLEMFSAFLAVARRLHFKHTCVAPAQRDQLRVRPFFYQPSALEYNDSVCHAYGRKAMGDQ